MKLYNTILKESKDFPPNFQEFFILPDSLCQENVKEMLGLIRSSTRGWWERLPRQTLECTPFDPSKKDAYNFVAGDFKYITTHCDEVGEQIFIFPKTVDHDCMYEMILNFEEDDTKEAYFRTKIGAGFTNFKTCRGRSETLNLDSRDNLDTALLVF